MPIQTHPPTAEPQAKRARRKEARPGELLAAALDLFVEKGFAATRVEEVAQRAGVSKGTLFLYFPSKEELFKAVVRQSLSARFFEWSAEVDDFTGSSADLLRHGMLSWWERVGDTQASGMTKLMLTEAHNFPEMAAFYQTEVALPYQGLIQRILQRGIDSGEFAPINTELATYSVTAPLIFLAMWKHSPVNHPCAPAALDPQAYLASQLHILLNGLRPRTSPL
ncbi:TetR/AcrR family transcriptional regulator [Rhodoferax sp.]|uniref:TetR/AcrR family transcriptional regulator n=1 Tax=Rhodoferax sp. TaxID=50421 RepID=UPI0025DA3FF8|nr:TetR/AcrR family transcriptional regulator [Rhodoferax sp.]